jgi:hypothetical protein
VPNILKAVGELLSPNDPELIEKTLARIDEQDKWNDVFSTKLIELLDNMDLVKSELRERMRSVEAANDAASATMERAELAWKATLRWSLIAIALCWIPTIWLAWLVLRPELPLYAAVVGSALLLVPIILIPRVVKKYEA